MKRMASICLLLLSAHFSTQTLAAETPQQAAWLMRYVIFVDTESWYQSSVRNSLKKSSKHVYMEGFFPAFLVKARGAKERLAAMHVDFNEQGKVITETMNHVPLLGVLEKIGPAIQSLVIVSIPGQLPNWQIDPHVYWERYQNPLPGEDGDWNENRTTLCSFDERKRMQAELIAEEDGPAFKYKLEPEEGIFYCNDWSEQLANPNRPWIDVTSYEKRGPRVRKFQGYGLFGVTKPVVGKHYKTWICFADCPDGKPGPIADIKAWSKQYGLPVENRNFGLE